MTVEAREPITVPAGTFQAFNAVCRNKKTGAPRYSAWYSPEVKQLVKLQENLDTGTRVRELIAFNLPATIAVASGQCPSHTRLTMTRD